jgi:hypothetical protein
MHDAGKRRQGVGDVRKHPLDVFFFRDVRLEIDCVGAPRCQLGEDAVDRALALAAAEQHDRARTTVGKVPGNGGADAACAAGHQIRSGVAKAERLG